MNMSRSKKFDDDEEIFTDDEDCESILPIVEIKRVQAKRRTNLRWKIEQRQEMKLLKEELGLYSRLDNDFDL